MIDFLKNYILGFVYTILFLPRLLASMVLFLLPGVPVIYILFLILPSNAQILASLAGLAVSIIVATSDTAYGRLIERIGSWRD